MESLQNKFDKCNSNEFIIPFGNYKGRLLINRPCIIDGNMSTLWGKEKPVLVINSKNVIIKNLKVNLIIENENNLNNICIKTNYEDTKLYEVEINANTNIEGFFNEKDNWDLPSMIDLKTFSPNEKNTFIFEINAISNAQIISNIEDLNINEKNLLIGKNKVILETEDIKNNITLFGEILIKTNVIRKINVIGKAELNAPKYNNFYININNNYKEDKKINLPIEFLPIDLLNENITYLSRGQRISIDEFRNYNIKIIYEHKYTKKPLEIDSYIFMLQSNGKVKNDNDLIFFGNNKSIDNAIEVKSLNEKLINLVQLKNVNNLVERISFCYSIYGEDYNLNFSLIQSPVIRIFVENNEVYRFELDNLNKERTIVGIDFYRYNGQWKLSVIGSGYNNGLRQLCESFGVNIE